MVATLLTLLATTPVQAFGEAATQDAHLGVTATVIRPMEISATSTAGGAVLVMRNTSAADVQALGGTITQKDRHGIAIKHDEGSPLTVIVRY